MSKHTEGPWTVIPPGHGSETEYLCVQIGEDDSYTTLEVLPADARLIASAPDLLAICEQTADALESNDPDLSLYWLAEQLRAALAKARGEEE